MQYFNIICGIATLLSFVLTITNTFPTHSKARNYFTLFALGCFLGSLIGGIKGFVINFPQDPATSGVLIFYIFVLIGLFFVLVTGLLTDDISKRNECFRIVSGGFGTLIVTGMLILMVYGISRANPPQPIPEDDLLAIANMNIAKGNLDRAISELDLFIQQCPSYDDARAEAARKKIDQLKNQQAKNISP